MGLRERGQAALIRRQQKARSTGFACTFRRGEESIDLTGKAWPDFSRGSSKVDGAVRIEFSEVDYLIPVADLVLAGKALIPQLGDTISDQFGAFVVTFSIQDPYTDEPAVRYSGVTRSLWRVHCKYKAKAGVP
jgi:hypothetical protein